MSQVDSDHRPEDLGEDLDAFRARARSWIRSNLRHIGPTTKTLRNELTDEEELAGVARDRELQRMFFDAGFAGICFPRENVGDWSLVGYS
jgi:alkylation response protein AidB-like acyl-CoA dehydrogenase